MSPAPPKPAPRLPVPEPESPEPELAEGGGGMTLLAKRPPFAEPLELRGLVPEPPLPTEGGGGMTEDAPGCVP